MKSVLAGDVLRRVLGVSKQLGIASVDFVGQRDMAASPAPMSSRSGSFRRRGTSTATDRRG
jgi:hypothetical protein